MIKKEQIMSTNDTKVLLTEKGIVNSELSDHIREFVEDDLEIAVSMETMLDPDVRDNVVNDIAGVMSDLYENNIVCQWDVICDRRNNSFNSEGKGIVNLDVKFKQWNCLNYTKLEYQIIRELRYKRKNNKKGRVIL